LLRRIEIPSLHGRFGRLVFKFIRFYKIADKNLRTSRGATGNSHWKTSTGTSFTSSASATAWNEAEGGKNIGSLNVKGK